MTRARRRDRRRAGRRRDRRRWDRPRRCTAGVCRSSPGCRSAPRSARGPTSASALPRSPATRSGRSRRRGSDWSLATSTVRARKSGAGRSRPARRSRRHRATPRAGSMKVLAPMPFENTAPRATGRSARSRRRPRSARPSSPPARVPGAAPVVRDREPSKIPGEHRAVGRSWPWPDPRRRRSRPPSRRSTRSSPGVVGGEDSVGGADHDVRRVGRVDHDLPRGGEATVGRRLRREQRERAQGRRAGHASSGHPTGPG